jgi:nicotinate-nucleotide pyrophosphorylase (carboxylating)
MELKEFIRLSLAEDIGDGDHTSLATIAEDKTGTAHLLVKENGIAAGIQLAAEIFRQIDPELKIQNFFNDGAVIQKEDILFEVNGKVRSILKGERLVLNCLQRMSGIATTTRKYAEHIKDTNARILDTRKTTPLMRPLEKWAVRIGGGFNHRFGLFDMILIKDNHVEAAGGIIPALQAARKYLDQNHLDLEIEIETRNLDEVQQALSVNIASRIMFDNFTPELISEALLLVNGKVETEASGGITLENIKSYALTGVNYISVGAITHSVKSLDLSLKIKG